MKEQQLMNSIMKYLRSKGYEVFRANSGFVQLSSGRYFNGLPTGFSDIFAIDTIGNVVFVEVKLPVLSSKATRMQVKFLKRMRFRGCKGGIASSLEEVDDILAGGVGNEEKFTKYKGYRKDSEDDKFWEDLLGE